MSHTTAKGPIRNDFAVPPSTSSNTASSPITTACSAPQRRAGGVLRRGASHHRALDGLGPEFAVQLHKGRAFADAKCAWPL